MTKTLPMNGLNTSIPRTPSAMQQLISKSIETIQLRQPVLLNLAGKLVTLPQEGDAIIVGDLHGDLASLKKILDDSKFPRRAQSDPKTLLICLGDYIDRGPSQIQVLATLLRLLIARPGQVILLRGNHEGPEDIPVQPHDYPAHLTRQYGRQGLSLYHETRELFNQFYTAAIVPGKALLLHGGIPTEAKDMQDVVNAHDTHPLKTHLAEILWNDPTTLPWDTTSPRGIGKQFGTDTTTRFLKQVGADIVIRGHEPCQQGYMLEANILTLFSCKLPVYRNTSAAYLDIQLQGDFTRAILSHVRRL